MTKEEVIKQALTDCADYVAQTTGSCPMDSFDYDMNCADECRSGKEASCWKQYFIDKVKVN